MLLLLQIFCCFFCVICISVGIGQGMQRWDKDNNVTTYKKKMDVSVQDLNFVTRILSIGLVDADPDILNHLKAYRDLKIISP